MAVIVATTITAAMTIAGNTIAATMTAPGTGIVVSGTQTITKTDVRATATMADAATGAVMIAEDMTMIAGMTVAGTAGIMTKITVVSTVVTGTAITTTTKRLRD